MFRLLVVADGFAPALSPKAADPTGAPPAFVLTPHDLDKRPAGRVVRGRVLDEQGRPIAGAMVEPHGFSKAGGGRYGSLVGFDELAVTDAAGRFRLGVPEDGLKLHVQVTAPQKCPKRANKLPAGEAGTDLTLAEGVSVRGRLVKNGKPVAGAAVGMVQRIRLVDTFVGPFQAATAETGGFLIPHVPADEVMELYGLMDQTRAHGAVPSRRLKTGASGTELDMGDVEVVPGLTLSGTLELADGKPIPAGTRVMLSREEAWDTTQAVVGADGRFAFDGLPAEQYTLSAGLEGYHLSPDNRSLDTVSPFRLIGSVTTDLSGLRVRYAPGPQPPRDATKDYDFAGRERLRGEPLRGVPEK